MWCFVGPQQWSWADDDLALMTLSSKVSRQASSKVSVLTQACLPTERGPRIFALGGASSLEKVVLEAPSKAAGKVGAGLWTPMCFHLFSLVSFFLSFSLG